MPKESFNLRIPASSSNLGPGFDCFGLALELFNIYKVELLDSFEEFEIKSNLDENFCINSKENIFYTSYLHLFKKNGIKEAPSIKVELEANIPGAGGFGSSGTAVLAGLMSANIALGSKLSDTEILKEAAILEKHPDNVCASLLGGFCLSNFQNDQLIYKQINWELDVEALMLYPTDFRVNTDDARKVLKKEQSISNCISNLSNSSFFTAAVLTQDIELLKNSIQDEIHEKERLELIPGAKEILEMAKENSSIGATISGSGASLIIFVDSASDVKKISNKAKEIWTANNLQSESTLCKISNSRALIY